MNADDFELGGEVTPHIVEVTSDLSEGVGSSAVGNAVNLPGRPQGVGSIGAGAEKSEVPRSGLDFGHYERLLEGVSDRFTSGLEPSERLKCEADSDKRWASLQNRLLENLLPGSEELHRSDVAQLLVDFAQVQPRRNRHTSHFPEGYRAMYAVMLWKYLAGASSSQTEIAVSRVEPANKMTISNIRTKFVGFVDGHLNPDSKKEQRTDTPTRQIRRVTSSRDKSHLAMAAAGQASRHRAEKDLKYSSPEASPTPVTERAALVDRVAKILGGNIGAYRQIFSLMKEVVVTEEDVAEARGNLWEAVVSNIMKRQERGSETLDNEEIVWLAPLCGKKLVADKKTKRLSAEDAEPRTLDEMKALAGYLERTHTYGEGRAERSPEDVERIIQNACRKLIALGTISPNE